MRQKTKYIDLSKLAPLCRLLAEDLRVSDRVQSGVVESLIHWWVASTDEAVIADLRQCMVLLTGSLCGRSLAEGLAASIDGNERSLAERTLELLRHFPDSAVTSMRVLVQIIRANSGGVRWRAASELAELGMSDELILAHVTSEVAVQAPAPDVSSLPQRAFSLTEYRAMYSAALNDSTSSEKGKALERLAEYIFLCVPGLHLRARNLRTLTEEIDLAFGNDGVGFWREIGSPFIVECRNLISPVDAKMIRDFKGKMQTKALRTGFVVTTKRLTRDARNEQRQALSDGRAIVSIEGEHLERIANGEDLKGIIEERFYTCRLL